MSSAEVGSECPQADSCGTLDGGGKLVQPAGREPVLAELRSSGGS